MQILKVIGLLMEYPDELLWECKEDALALIRRDAPILTDFTRNLLNAPLLDKQAEWCEVFDRGRTTSLLLFEHVHAESRDRGQAMVDLLAEYEKVGLQLNCRELPRLSTAVSGVFKRTFRTIRRKKDYSTLRRSSPCLADA
ncbi:respiratory nitrate reductase 2 subunit delta [Escherichia coli]|uniref:Respiratory nitrate reductase 2 subunit delta n=1 Tax=Escherichia coli TaxID=562 RepID=A0A377K8H6_ECOLX|nr:respiratory nitrate reductase 2 subunit delta [Escherichia coli]